MFGKSKGDAAEEDRDVKSAQEVQRSTATPGASEAISSISSGLSIVGKIVGHGAVTSWSRRGRATRLDRRNR